MGLYELVSTPAVLLNEDGSVTIHRTEGELLELSDEQVAQVADCVRQIGVEPREEADPATALGQSVTFVAAPEGSTFIETSDAEVVEPPAASEPVEAPAPEPKPRPRSRSKDAGADGEN